MVSRLRVIIPIFLIVAIALGGYFYLISSNRSQLNADSITIIKRRIIKNDTKNQTIDDKITQIGQDTNSIQSTISNPIVDELANDLNKF